MTIFAGAMLCWQIVESSFLRPDYLAYFNQVAGGPKNGYKHLVDSSLDWGQDLPALTSWLAQNPDRFGTGRLYLAYFGTALPEWYGIQATSLPCDRSAPKLAPLKPGTYCISATALQQVYSLQHGKWTREYEADYHLALVRSIHESDLAIMNRRHIMKICNAFVLPACARTFATATQSRTWEIQSWFFTSVNENWIRPSMVPRPICSALVGWRCSIRYL